jgi:bla regulator protein BlaR1
MHVLLDALLANALVALFLALLAALVSLKVRRPALVHAMWLIVLLKLVTPPLFSIHWPLAEKPALETAASGDEADMESVEAATPVVLPPDRDEIVSTRQQLVEALGALRAEREAVRAAGLLAPAPAFPWKSWYAVRTVLGCLWLAGSLIWLSVFVWRVLTFHRLLGLGQPADDDLQAQAADLARRIGLQHCPLVWVVPGRVSPLLWKFGRRGRLVLPEALLASLNRDQRAALLAHEMAHAHRLDHWVRWVESFALGLYWWNPVVWWARRELHQAEEECCDAWVVWILPGAARAYAKALLQTVTFLDARPCLPPVASGAGHVSLLKRRLSMIVNEPLSPRLPKPLFFAALAWGLLVLPFAPARVIANSANMDPGPQSSGRQSSQSVDQRIQAIEAKLDKVLQALDAQGKLDAKPKKRASEDGQRDDEMSRKRVSEAEARAKAIAARAEERAREHAAQAEERSKTHAAQADAHRKQATELREQGLKQAAEARAMADQARKAVAEARKELQKQTEQIRSEAERSARRAGAGARARSGDEKEKAAKDEKSEKSEKSERKVILNGNLNPRMKVDLEKMLKEKMGADFKADELRKIIQDSVDPAKMRQLQVQMKDVIRKAMDEKSREMDKVFEETRKNLEQKRNLLEKKQVDTTRGQSETRTRVDGARARDNEMREVQRRLERLEQRLDKVISSLESQQRERRRPEGN